MLIIGRCQNDFRDTCRICVSIKALLNTPRLLLLASYGMNAFTYTGNGKQRAIGQTKFSDFVTGTQFGTSYSKERAINEDLDDALLPK